MNTFCLKFRRSAGLEAELVYLFMYLCYVIHALILALKISRNIN